MIRYMYWKSYFAEDVLAFKGVTRGFKKGLELMNQASTLGDDAKYRCVHVLPSVWIVADPMTSGSNVPIRQFRSLLPRRPPPPNLIPRHKLPSQRRHSDPSPKSLLLLPTSCSCRLGERTSEGTLYFAFPTMWTARAGSPFTWKTMWYGCRTRTSGNQSAWRIWSLGRARDDMSHEQFNSAFDRKSMLAPRA